MDYAPEEMMGDIMSKWDHLITNVNRMGSIFKHLRTTLGDDMDSLQDKITVVDSKIGVKGDSSTFEDCLTTWEALSFLQQGLIETGELVGTLHNQITSDTKHLKETMNGQQSAVSTELEAFRRGLNDVVNLVAILNNAQDAIILKTQ